MPLGRKLRSDYIARSFNCLQIEPYIIFGNRIYMKNVHNYIKTNSHETLWFHINNLYLQLHIRRHNTRRRINVTIRSQLNLCGKGRGICRGAPGKLTDDWLQGVKTVTYCRTQQTKINVTKSKIIK